MNNNGNGITRRQSLKAIGAAAGLFAVGLPMELSAQEPIRLATLCPLTGAGGPYGPQMQEVVIRVVKEINDSGGIHGHQIQLLNEDSQTNPEAAVRAAHKLIDVNKVIAIMGTWASAVTLAVAPICYTNKVLKSLCQGRIQSLTFRMMITSSGPSPTPSSRRKFTESSDLRKAGRRLLIWLSRHLLQRPLETPIRKWLRQAAEKSSNTWFTKQIDLPIEVN